MTVQEVSIERIDPNPFQPRQTQDEAALVALAADIAARGLIQPPVGRWRWNGDGRIQLACGHRRLEACRRLGWEAIPVDIRDLSDQELALLAWSENESRQDLNPLDRATAIQRMMESFGWTQEETARRLGLARSTVANILRLLSLQQDVQGALAAGHISERQALALAPLSELKWNFAQSFTRNRIQDLLAGKLELSSDEIRELIKQARQEATRFLQPPPWGFDGDPGCQRCQHRKKNRCFDPECFGQKAREYSRRAVEAAVRETGFLAAEDADAGDSIYGPAVEVARERQCPHACVTPDKWGAAIPRFACTREGGCECSAEARRRQEENLARRKAEAEELRRSLAAALERGFRQRDARAWRALMLVLHLRDDGDEIAAVARYVAEWLTGSRSMPATMAIVAEILEQSDESRAAVVR